jgi:ubiquinone/menaquinone biosynthesis C-methylase UbiE
VSGRVAKDFQTRGTSVHWVGVDLARTALAVAAGAGGSDSGRLGLVAADARALPFRDGSFDLSTATLTLHHFRDEECLGVLAEMGRVSKHAVIVSDLERNAMNYLGARLVSETLWRGDRLARNDAALSVRRSFTADELRSLAERVGFRRVEVRRHFPFRIVLEAWP